MALGPNFYARKVASAIALSTALAIPSLAAADEVTLKSADGTVNLVGDFVEFVDNNYVIRTGLGDLRISASRVSCEGAACPSFENVEADVLIAGSDTVGQGVMPLLLSGYASFLGAEVTQSATGNGGEFLAEMIGDEGFGDPMGSFLVSPSNSNDAFSALLAKESQIGMSSRRIVPVEARALRDDGAGNMINPNQEHIIAIESLVVIVNPDNPVRNLSLDQLRGIYNGTITNWSEVGGSDAPIAVFARSSDTGAQGVFNDVVFGDNPPSLPASVTIATDNNEMASGVNADPNAIGFSGFAFQRGARSITLTNDCGLTMTPDAFSARTEEYGLQRFLYLYTREDTTDAPTRDLINYAISDGADDVITKAGFIDLGVDRKPQPLDGDRARQLLDPNVDAYEGGVMREMLGQMVNYDRLSSTFRFRTGSPNLDARGRLNLERLADYLETQPVGTEVLFVGFTDSVGAFDSNRQLSVSRASQVLGEIQNFAGDRLGNVSMDIAGYGEIAPTACNTSEAERRINRRVEVWIRTPS